MSKSVEPLAALQEILPLLAEANAGSQQHLKEIRRRLKEQPQWAEPLMRLAAEAEQKLLELLPVDARELTRRQSLRERDDLTPITRLEWVLAEAIRLDWLAAEVLLRRLKASDKRFERVWQRKVRRQAWWFAHRRLLLARKNFSRQRRLLMLRSDIPPEYWLKATKAPRPAWIPGP